MTVVTSLTNPAVKAARKLHRRQGRSRAGDAFLVEGPQAAGQAGPFLQQLFVTSQAAADHAELVAEARRLGAEVLPVADAVLQHVATTVTPQGLVGVARLPVPALDDVLAAARLVVVLHQVRDPGNAGTALRSPDAAGVDAVVVTRGSVDPRNPKAVRASSGSLFHLPVIDDQPFEAVAAACRAHGLRIVAAAAQGALPHTEADLAGRVAVVFGNEAHGLPTHVLEACDEVIRVTLHDAVRPGYTGTAESLNLAASVAVITFEAARQAGAGRRPAPTGIEKG